MKKMILALGLIVLSIAAPAQSRGVVSISVANLREVPDYAGEMGTQALMGTIVDIVGSEGYWLQVVTPDGYKAWVNEMAVKQFRQEDESLYAKADKAVCTARNSIIFSKPSTRSKPVSDLVRGDIVVRDHGTARHGMVPVSTPDGRHGWVAKRDLEDETAWRSTRRCTGADIVAEALEYVGVPYLWGGNSPKGFDCSGLTSYAALMNGRVLPRNASQQARIGFEVGLEELREGDLLFFGNRETGRVTHVGIYIGDGHMVHASQLVRVNSIREGDPDCYENFSRFLFARRIFD